MKFLVFALLSCLTLTTIQAQTKDPVQWSYMAVKKSSILYEVIITATLPKPWHIYSQNTGDGGPIPTKITFSKNPLVIFMGKIEEKGNLEKKYDENFKTNVLNYSDKVSFVQQVKVRPNAITRIIAKVEYMVCNDEMCLPPTTKQFSININ
jgi:DsbC/DsbD-like thiol-disulfide interchange protein